MPKMVERQKELETAIVGFWEEKVKPKLGHLDIYTVDLVVDPDDFSNIKLIELNPPPPAAGQALFDWNKTADRAIITNGPFEFRIEATGKEDPLEGIHSASRQLIHLLRGRQATERQLANVRCDVCAKSPISDSDFYSCTSCGSFDVCPSCLTENVGNTGSHAHTLIIQTPLHKPTHPVNEDAREPHRRCVVM